MTDIFIPIQNDHGPEFSESTYNVTVREDAPPGTVIAILSASDEDFGEFGKVINIGALKGFGQQHNIFKDI